jgi:hypothetical protein
VEKLSGAEEALVFVVSVIMAFLGYHLAEGDKRNLGRTPWGVPSLGWAAIWFLSPLVGLVLWLFAHRAEVRRSAQAPLGTLGGAAPPPSAEPARSVGSDFPAYPRRADGGTAPHAAPTPPAAHAPAVPTPPSAPPAVAPGADVSPPAWHPDPSGRFHYRWWTGSEWTSYVSTHGRMETDTSPDQRIGPY